MTNKALIVICFILLLQAGGLCATRVGTTIESQAFISYSGTTEISASISTIVTQIYGLSITPTLDSGAAAGGDKCYFAKSLVNVGNGSARIYLSASAISAGWGTSLVVDDNRDGIHEETETTEVLASIILAEDAEYNFFLVLNSPDSAWIGTTGEGMVAASTEVQDGPTYAGGNGEIYGGDDTVSSTSELTVGMLGNARIWRDDANKKIFLTWGGGPADVYYRTAFGTAFEGGSTEATNILSPWTSEAVDSQDGSIRFYRVARTGTASFAATIMGKYDVPVSEGINQLSIPFIPYETSLESVIGTQVTGANNAFSSDRLWLYNPAVQARYDVAWLVAGVGPPYDGKWYSGNFPSTLPIRPDMGFILQIRAGHPATYITFVGKVSETDRYTNISTGLNFVGTCFPVEVPLGDQASVGDSNLWESGITGGTNAFSSDKVWKYNAAVQARYDVAWLVDGIDPAHNGLWYSGNVPSTIKLKPGYGYWIQIRSGHPSFVWHYPKPY